MTPLGRMLISTMLVVAFGALVAGHRHRDR